MMNYCKTLIFVVCLFQVVDKTKPMNVVSTVLLWFLLLTFCFSFVLLLVFPLNNQNDFIFISAAS